MQQQKLGCVRQTCLPVEDLEAVNVRRAVLNVVRHGMTLLARAGAYYTPLSQIRSNLSTAHGAVISASPRLQLRKCSCTHREHVGDLPHHTREQEPTPVERARSQTEISRRRKHRSLRPVP